MQAAIDPAFLAPPDCSGVALDEWVIDMAAWTELISDGPVHASCPTVVQELAYGAWWEEYGSIEEALAALGYPYRVSDLLVILDSFRARLLDSVLGAEHEILFSTIVTTPHYQPPKFDGE